MDRHPHELSNNLAFYFSSPVPSHNCFFTLKATLMQIIIITICVVGLLSPIPIKPPHNQLYTFWAQAFYPSPCQICLTPLMPRTFPMGLKTNDLLEQYQKSPAATRRFKRMDWSAPSPIKPNLSVSTHAGGAGNFNSMYSLPLSDPPTFLMLTTIVAQTLLTTSWPRNLMRKITRTLQLAKRHLTLAQSQTHNFCLKTTMVPQVRLI